MPNIDEGMLLGEMVNRTDKAFDLICEKMTISTGSLLIASAIITLAVEVRRIADQNVSTQPKSMED